MSLSSGRNYNKATERDVNAFRKEFKGKRNFCCYVLHKLNNNLHKHIWKRRCIYTAAISDDLIQEKTEEETPEVEGKEAYERRKEVIDRTNRKVDIWRDLFINFNTSSTYIESINADLERGD